MSDRISGHLEVGTNGCGEVVVNHPRIEVDAQGVGHTVFSPTQTRSFASALLRKALEAEIEKDEGMPRDPDDDDVRAELARILGQVAAEGLAGPRDLDGAIDTILATLGKLGTV